MYKRLWILSFVIVAALAAFYVMGMHSINIHENGLRAQRQAGFLEVAENIRIDVNRKFNEFIRSEQAVPYTYYQHFYIPIASNQADALLVSPLADKFDNGLARGYFQIEPDGSLTSPYQSSSQRGTPAGNQTAYTKGLKAALIPELNTRENIVEPLSGNTSVDTEMVKDVPDDLETEMTQQKAAPRNTRTDSFLNFHSYKIAPSKEQNQTQVLHQSRRNVESNIANSVSSQPVETKYSYTDKNRQADMTIAKKTNSDEDIETDSLKKQPKQFLDSISSVDFKMDNGNSDNQSQSEDDLVKIRIEPFYPVITDRGKQNELFGGRVFMIRHIQIEDKHFLQGFELNQNELRTEIIESASRFARGYMQFDISGQQDYSAAHSAILQFDFGKVVLNFFDMNPGQIVRQVDFLRNLFLGIIAVVFSITTIAMISLWRNISAQIALARKKDDFISAVSHELRTPLTSIRMYSEMLENNWIKDRSKIKEYYGNMRQESERLSRLIENVLDFSRIQRGRKKYNFIVGDLNDCVRRVAEMMSPCARQAGFTIEQRLCEDSRMKQASGMMFDADAVSQIVINLIDNAIKYSAESDDKTIYVRTAFDGKYIIIEVEDRGPGIPKIQRKKIFEEFYRIGSESTRKTTGTGLGLALVKKFVEAHNGLIEVLTAKPSGVVFRICIPFEKRI